VHIQWQGKSGQLYDCELQPINTSFEETGGVYILCKPNEVGRWDGVEVGIAESFRSTITYQAANLIGRFPEATHVALIAFDNSTLAEDALGDLTLD